MVSPLIASLVWAVLLLPVLVLELSTLRNVRASRSAAGSVPKPVGRHAELEIGGIVATQVALVLLNFGLSLVWLLFAPDGLRYPAFDVIIHALVWLDFAWFVAATGGLMWILSRYLEFAPRFLLRHLRSADKIRSAKRGALISALLVGVVGVLTPVVIVYVYHLGAPIPSIPSPPRDIWEAARRGSARQMRSFLREDPAAITARDSEERTLLHEAALEDNSAAAAVLLEKGADPNARDRGGVTPLHEAVLIRSPTSAGRARNEEAIRLLLGAGADVNIADSFGRTPLSFAVQDGDEFEAVVELLLQAGADQNVTPGAFRMMPLHWAALRGSEGCARTLLAYRADVNAMDWDLNTPLDLAVERGNGIVAELLRQHGGRESPFGDAARAKWSELLERGWTPAEAEGASELSGPAFEGDVEVVRALLSRGAPVDGVDERDRTALHIAAMAMGGHKEEVTAALLEAGADPNAKDGDGCTVLHYAAACDGPQVLHLLLAAGADPNAWADCRWLAGEPWSRGGVGWSTVSSGSSDALSRATPLHLAVIACPDGVEELLRAGADINAQARNGWTCMHFAAILGEEGLVEFLAELGAAVHARDLLGRTPLHWAARAESTEVAELLLKRGADVDATDPEGRTPLHVVVTETGGVGRRDFDILVRFVECLLEHGADVNAKDAWGYTPLREALRSGYPTVPQLLRDHGGREEPAEPWW